MGQTGADIEALLDQFREAVRANIRGRVHQIHSLEHREAPQADLFGKLLPLRSPDLVNSRHQ